MNTQEKKGYKEVSYEDFRDYHALHTYLMFQYNNNKRYIQEYMNKYDFFKFILEIYNNGVYKNIYEVPKDKLTISSFEGDISMPISGLIASKLHFIKLKMEFSVEDYLRFKMIIQTILIEVTKLLNKDESLTRITRLDSVYLGDIL